MTTDRTKTLDAPRVGGLPHFSRLFRPWRSLGARIRRRRAAWQLRAASDALLRDIGLSRSELTIVTTLRPSHHL